MKKIFYALLLLTTIATIQAQTKPAISKEQACVLAYFKQKQNTEMYDAAVFLVENMHIHHSENSFWVDQSNKTVPFEAGQYKDIEEAKAKFNHLKDSIVLAPKIQLSQDTEAFKCQFITDNITLAYNAWKNSPWSKTYDFKTFCEYILPYRSLTEPMQDWRSEYKMTFEKLSVGMNDPADPVELCSKIIGDIKHFDFVLKRFDPKPLLGPKELLFWREGNCPDLANVAIFAARSLCVATTFDYTPHYAASSNRHYWNTVIDNKGVHIPFNGNQDLPYVYNAVAKRLGKVFRVTFSEQKGNLITVIPENEIPDDFLKSKNILDVTSEYVEVSDISYSFNLQVTSKVSYINVFNRGNWRPLDWSKINNKTAIYKNMGRDIVYLPSVFVSGKMVFENYPILLDTKGVKTILKPDPLKSFPAVLSRENEYKNKHTDNNPFQIIKGEKYKLFVWFGTWQLVEEQIASDDNKVSFKKIPENGLFLMCSSKPDFYERIFTINPVSNLITWY